MQMLLQGFTRRLPLQFVWLFLSSCRFNNFFI